MPLPRSREARLYYQAAKQRLEDARLLLQAGRTTGAVYLAGYTVECMLKALILDSVSRSLGMRLLADFRGGRAHQIAWLESLYRRHAGLSLPRDVVRCLSRVDWWSTEMRYLPRAVRSDEAEEFMEAVVAIVQWANGRMGSR